MASGLPDALAAFASASVGEVVGVVDRSWARENSAVWELTTASAGRFFLKRHPSSKFHEREVTALRQLMPCLERDRAPELVAADRGLLAVVVTALPGEVALGAALPVAEERELYLQAGLLASRIHSLGIEVSGAQGFEGVVGRCEEHLREADGLLASQEVALVRECAARLAVVAPSLPVNATHGDFQPRNFLWDRNQRRLALIDFERAELGPPIRDLVRLESGPWDGRPDLREAFLNGYGRQLTARERAALLCMEALDTLSGLLWSTEHGDVEVAQRARASFARLLR
ncbi:MAG: hydrolase [Actinomycetia bacterium]|nr:hydrolase [Actinomycetes bacterium]